jgi:hypothetical protein
MATGTAGNTARQLSIQAVHFLRKDITFADAGTTVVVGDIPAGSVILQSASGVNVSTVFNGGSTNTIDIGASDDSGTDNFATIMDLATANFHELDVTGSYYVSSKTTVSAAVVSTANASTGVAQIVIAYVPNM